MNALRSAIVLGIVAFAAMLGPVACSPAATQEPAPVAPHADAILLIAPDASVSAVGDAASSEVPPAPAPAPASTLDAAAPGSPPSARSQPDLFQAAVVALQRHKPPTKADRAEAKELYVRGCVNGVFDDTMLTMMACEHAFQAFAASAGRLPKAAPSLRPDVTPVDLGEGPGVSASGDLHIRDVPSPALPAVHIGEVQASVPLLTVQGVAADLRPRMRTCLRETEGKTRGSLSVSVTLGAQGRVGDATATNLVGVTEAQVACIVGAIKRAEFGTQAATTFVIPISFEPAPDRKQ